MMKLNSKQKKAFTLIELLIVIAIIGILFIVLVSKVDFATDKAKASGVQTDFRSFQVAFESVSKEHAGFNTFGWDTGDNGGESSTITINGKNYDYINAVKDRGDRIRNAYDEGDCNLNGIYDDGETWTGRKIYTETWTGCYTLINPGNANDYSAIFDLETAINKNLDPKLHINIADDGVITMANGLKDPWSTQYHGRYITNASADAAAKWNTDASMTGSTGDNMDRGAILMFSNGANQKFGTKVKIEKGVVTATVSQIDANTPDNNKTGVDDYIMATMYTYTNGYGETATITQGFSNDQTFSPGNGGIVNNDHLNNTPEDSEIGSDDGYQLLSGNGLKVTMPCDIGFKTNSTSADFIGVKIGTTELNPSDYTMSADGALVVKKEFIETLPNGEYKIEIQFQGGKVVGTFEVATAEPGQIPVGGMYFFADSSAYCSTCYFEFGFTPETCYCGAMKNHLREHLNEGDYFPELKDGDVFTYGDYIYTYNTAYNGWKVSVLDKTKFSYGEILSSMNDRNVYSIDNLFFERYTWRYEGNTNLTTAPVIPETVISMKYAFAGCTNLYTVPTIPNSIIDMECAFAGCTKITIAPELPDSVVNLNGTFADCSALNTPPSTIPNTVTNMDKTFYQCTNLQTASDFSNATGVKSMANVFEGCIKISSISSLPSAVEDLSYAFSGMTLLQQVAQIPESVVKLNYTFCDCISLNHTPDLSKATLVKEMNSMFYGCTSLTTPPDLSNALCIESMVATFFGCSNLQSAPVINSTVLTNMCVAFAGCEKIESVSIPNSVTDLSETFRGCSSLKVAPKLPENVTTLYSTFAGCSALQTYEGAPNGIAEGDFRGWVIPNTVTNVDYAFVSCSLMTHSPIMPTNLTSMNGVFQQCTNLITIPRIPDGVTSTNLLFYNCTSILRYEGMEDGVFNGDFSDYVLPSGLKDASGLFTGCYTILHAPYLPDSITHMSSIFEKCTSLMTIQNIPDSAQNMQSSFSNCSSLQTIPDAIPSSVKYLDKAFSKCSLLRGTITINANPSQFSSCFYQVNFKTYGLKLAGTSTKLDSIGATGTNYCATCNGKCENNH